MNEQGDRARDSQRSRLYAAERAALEGVGPQGMSIDECQAYVDKVLRSAFIQTRWGRRQVRVVPTRGGGNSRGGVIALGVWARQHTVILHELAHELTSNRYAWHGPEFAACLLLLVGRFMGPEYAAKLREEFRARNVRHRTGAAALPKPGTRRVVTQQETKSAARQRVMTPLSDAERRQAATYLRRAIATGVFGEPGRKPRAHAQAVARTLEKNP